MVPKFENFTDWLRDGTFAELKTCKLRFNLDFHIISL